MNKQPRGRIFQSDNFTFSEFNELGIEKLIVCEIPETSSIATVYLKVENNSWYNFFLERGFAVWENCGHFEEDDSYNYADKTNELQISNKTITKIYCEPNEKHCQIIIELKNGDKIVLRALNPKDYKSDIEFIKLEKVFCVHDYWDMTILSGVANYKNKIFHFENVLDIQQEDFGDEYILTELTEEIFIAVQENWNYWLSWLKQTKVEHPNNYAEKRKTRSYESLLSEYGKVKIQKAEKYYQTELFINDFIKSNAKKTKLKGTFEGSLSGTNTFVQWRQMPPIK